MDTAAHVRSHVNFLRSSVHFLKECYKMVCMSVCRVRSILGVMYVAIKVGLILAVEAGIFPLLCGWWIDICAFVSPPPSLSSLLPLSHLPLSPSLSSLLPPSLPLFLLLFHTNNVLMCCENLFLWWLWPLYGVILHHSGSVWVHHVLQTRESPESPRYTHTLIPVASSCTPYASCSPL